MAVRLIAATLLLAGCAGSLPPPSGSCGALVGGDFEDRFHPTELTQEEVDEAVLRAMDATSLTTDLSISDPVENCKALQNYRVYTMRVPEFINFGRSASGVTECWFDRILIGTPESGNFIRDTALVHEFIHAFQRCHATLPLDPGRDKDHANWDRDGIEAAVNYERFK